MSYPTFLALRPRGPSLGASVAAGPASPPKTLMLTVISIECTESNLTWIDLWWHCMANFI